MNPDALSDLVLLAACAASAWRVAVVRAAWRGAMLLLGLAAAMGVLRYSGLEWALGPHRFFSLLAACVAFWLMVAALRWPQAPLARQATAVGRFVVLLGGLGIAASQVGGCLVGAGGTGTERVGAGLDHGAAALCPGDTG